MTVISRRPFGTVVDPDELSNDVRELATAIDKLSAGRDLTIEWHSLVKGAAGTNHTISGKVVDSQGTRVEDNFFILVFLSKGEEDIDRPAGVQPVVNSLGNLVANYRRLDTEGTTEDYITTVHRTKADGTFGVNARVDSVASRTGGVWAHGVVLGRVRAVRMFDNST